MLATSFKFASFGSRYIYWTDWGQAAKIERMSMDGDFSTRAILHNLTGSWPNGLSIDFTLFRIYWTDAKLKVIESSRLDGSDRRQILYLPAQHPFSITVFEDFMYWSDWTSEAIYKANKFTGKGRTQIISQAYSMMGVEIYHPLRQPNGMCLYLYVFIPICVYTYVRFYLFLFLPICVFTYRCVFAIMSLFYDYIMNISCLGLPANLSEI